MRKAEEIQQKIKRIKALELKAHAEDCKLPKFKKLNFSSLAINNYKRSQSGVFYRI